MFVRDCMTANPRTIEPGATLEEAFGLMRALKIRHLPVVDGSALVGIISWTDLVGMFASSWTAPRSRASAAARNARVAGVMTRDPFTIAPDAPVEVAARLLRERKIGSLPVVDRKKLVGIVTESDLFDTLVQLLGGDIRGVRMSIVLPNGLYDLARIAQTLGDLTAEKEAVTIVARLDGAYRSAHLRVATASPLLLADRLADAGFRVSDIRFEPPERPGRTHSAGRR